MTSLKYGLPAVVLASLVLGIAEAREPKIETGEDAVITVDGLYKVTHTGIDTVYAKPDIDLSPYKKVMVAPVSIAYDKKSFNLTEKQVQRMDKYFLQALNDQLTEKGYEVVTVPGPDVLLVNASIVDLYVNRPTKPSVGRSTLFTATSGEMTLIGELKDSMSGEILVRFADRQQPRSHWKQSTSVSEWSEVRRAFRFWAGVLRQRLDVFHRSED